MTRESSKGARTVPFIGEGQPGGESSNDWFLTREEFVDSAAAAVRNAQKSERAESWAGEEQADRAGTTKAVMKSHWAPEYEKILAGKVYFLMDYCNLQESKWMRGRRIVSDHGVRKFFTEMCWPHQKPGLYDDFDAHLSRVKHFPIPEIGTMVRSDHRYVWLSYEAPLLGSPVRRDRNRHIVEALDFVAIAVGSAFNGGYYGVHLHRVVPGCPDVYKSTVAIFYGGRVYENPAEVDPPRLSGSDS